MSMEQELAKAVEEAVRPRVSQTPMQPKDAQPTIGGLSSLPTTRTLAIPGGGTSSEQNRNAHNPIEAVQLALDAVVSLEKVVVTTCASLTGFTTNVAPHHSLVADERSTVGRINAMTRELTARCNHMDTLLERIRTMFSA